MDIFLTSCATAVTIGILAIVFLADLDASWELSAIHHHAAYWTVDDRGESTFHWNDEDTK